MRSSLSRAREVFSAVARLGAAQRPLTPEFWDELEEMLIVADFGVPTTSKIVTGLQTVAKQEDWKTSDQVVARFRKDVERFLTLPGAELTLEPAPAVMLIVGVNGSGKTTTIGKLAARLHKMKKRVLLVAGDTFRAAAAEQLAVWAERSGSTVVRGAEGADPASVVFDGIRAAKARGFDVVLVDTAGRLQTKANLMEELKKMRRVIERELDGPPAETLLVVDGTSGQNAISQAKLFNAATAAHGHRRYEARLHRKRRSARRNRRRAGDSDQARWAGRRHGRLTSLLAGRVHRRALRRGGDGCNIVSGS